MAELTIIGPGSVTLGRGVAVHPGVKAIFSEPANIFLGDYVSIGEGTKFIIESGDVTIDDWSTLHNDCTVLSKRGVTIGQHGWFGQSTVIDGTGGMTIGNGVRVGMYSQLWSHVAAGEQIEGCTLYGETPSELRDHVWLVGTCYLASGVTVGERTVALAGSNITKSCSADTVLAGAPARPREGVSFYRPVSLNEKMAMLARWIDHFRSRWGHGRLIVKATEAILEVNAGQDGKVIFYRSAEDLAMAGVESEALVTHCCLETKTYNKVYSSLEAQLLKYLSGNKARFLRR